MVIILKKKKGNSNKPETLPIIDHKLEQDDPSISLKTWPAPAPFIDKISIVLTLPKAVGNDMYNELFPDLNDTAIFVDAPKGKGAGFNLAKRIVLPSIVIEKKRPLLQLRYNKIDAVIERLRLEFVPVDLAATGMKELHSVLGAYIEDGWDYVRKHGRITRIDVAVDLPQTQMDSFLYLPMQGLTMSTWKVNGELQTAAYGKKGGNQTLIYDRGAKRKAIGQYGPEKQGVRVERRITKTGNMPISKLVGFPNPFEKMTFVSALPSKPPTVAPAAWQWLTFCDSVHVRGLSNALALLPKDRKTIYRKHIAQHPKSWWDPKAMWDKWPIMLQQMMFAANQK